MSGIRRTALALTLAALVAAAGAPAASADPLTPPTVSPMYGPGRCC